MQLFALTCLLATLLASVCGQGLVGPQVKNVTVTATMTGSTQGGVQYLIVGSQLHIIVGFTEPVVATNPNDLKLGLKIGGVTRFATYVTGSGTDAIEFQYTIIATDANNGGPIDFSTPFGSALVVGSGSFTDLSTDNVVNTTSFENIPADSLTNEAFGVDTVGPTVTSVTFSTGNFGINQFVLIYVNLDKPVTVTGTPTIEVGGLSFVYDPTLSTTAANTPNSNSQLVFAYRVTSSTSVASFISLFNQGNVEFNFPVTSSIADGGGVTYVTGTLGTAVTTAVTTGATTSGVNGVFILPLTGLTSAISVSGSSLSGSNTLRVGDQVLITVTFDRHVDFLGAAAITGSGNGNITIPLNNGGIAVFNGITTDIDGGNGTQAQFLYTVAASDASTDHLDVATGGIITLSGGANITSLVSIGGSLVTAEIDLSLPQGQSDNPSNQTSLYYSNLAVEGGVVSIINVQLDSNTPIGGVNGFPYFWGQAITIDVEFNAPVTVNGNASIALNTGGFAYYSGQQSTDQTTLYFVYYVRYRDSTNSLAIVNTTALTLVGSGTITDTTSDHNNTDLTLPSSDLNLGVKVVGEPDINFQIYVYVQDTNGCNSANLNNDYATIETAVYNAFPSFNFYPNTTTICTGNTGNSQYPANLELIFSVYGVSASTGQNEFNAAVGNLTSSINSNSNLHLTDVEFNGNGVMTGPTMIMSLAVMLLCMLMKN